jgi:hypothetical protein
MTSNKGEKVGIMISATAASPSFVQGISAADAALREGAIVYLYLIDGGVEGVNLPAVADVKNAGAHLYACAYSLQRRGLNAPPEATLSGLTILSDIMASANRFESFN